ncbi:class I SAM-dependent methyltransferase [Haloferacaceae archaeon DSL9]
MNVPCVRAAREDGEAIRQRLADAGILDADREIVVDDGAIYIPVTDEAAVPSDLEATTYDLPPRATATTPADMLGFEPSLERLGDLVIVDEEDADRAQAIADAVVASDLPAETVINRASKIRGELRVRDWDVLAGNGTETVHREYGHEFLLDVSTVYFSPRLATERHRVVRQVEPTERVFDMFAGVGPFVVPCAARGADVVGVDLNERAVEYLRENAERNGVEARVTAIHGDVRDVAVDYRDWADRIVMNLPHSANEFVDAAVAVAGDDCVIHYYDIQPEDDPFGPGLEAIRAAAEPEYDVSVEAERVVRSYAPHEYNVCLDVRLVRRDGD